MNTLDHSNYYSYLHTFLSQIPIIKLDESDQLPFIKKGERLTSNLMEIQLKLNKFRSRVLERFPNHSLHRKLSKFYELDFSTLIDIIYKRSTHKLSLKEADEWQDYFNAHKSDILRLIDENRRLVTELDSMVFDLYGLTEEQRNIIVRSLESE